MYVTLSSSVQTFCVCLHGEKLPIGAGLGRHHASSKFSTFTPSVCRFWVCCRTLISAAEYGVIFCTDHMLWLVSMHESNSRCPHKLEQVIWWCKNRELWLPCSGKFSWGPNFVLCYLQLICVFNFRSVHFTQENTPIITYISCVKFSFW